MPFTKILSHIRVDENSRTPKYRQIVESIIENISLGNLEVNQKIPSINMLSEEFLLSRDTVEKAYNVLKERRIITSVKGKGFYVTRTPLLARNNILFLVNKLSSYKMLIYKSFRESLGKDYHVDLHAYHCDEELFLTLLRKNEKVYDYFVIMPHFRTSGGRHVSTTDEVTKALNRVPAHRRIILDNGKSDLSGDYGIIYQDFEDDLYGALSQANHKVTRYKKMVIAHQLSSLYPYPRRILYGFRKFCVENKIEFLVIDSVPESMPIERGALYLTISENDLVNLMRSARDAGLKAGKDFGVISYNETPLKDLLGITTVSTNFVTMGLTAADFIKNNKLTKVHNPFVYTDRSSL